jgi:AcrR family transcriptional regulator
MDHGRISEMTKNEDPRRREILKAAGELFFEQGFAQTSIDSIIARVGGSKRTIYALFGNKAGLFKEIILENSEELFNQPIPTLNQSHHIEEALEVFALRLLEMITNPRALGVYKLVTREAPQFPELGRIYFEQGPERARRWLAEILAQAQENGQIRMEDPELAAAHFFGMVRGDLMLELLLQREETLSPAEIHRRAKSATKVFLDGIRTKPDVETATE